MSLAINLRGGGKTLCVLSFHLGDCVCLLSRIRFLAEMYGGPVDILLKQEALSPIFGGLNYIGRVFIAPHWKFTPLLVHKIRSLKMDRYDRVYFFSTIHMRKFLGVFSKIGNTPSQISFEIPKEIRDCGTTPFRPVVLTTTDRECDDVRELLRDNYGWAGEKLILVHPGSSYTEKSGKRAVNPKEWPTDNWRGVVAGIGKLAPDAMLVLTGTANERKITEKILADVTVKSVSLAGDFSLRQLFALQSIAHSCITVDTGVAHTATALGCPTVILYGNFDPRTMGACSPKGWGPTITIRGFRDAGELNSQIIADPIKNIRPETVVRLWEKLPPRSNEPCSECLVSHYCEGDMTGEVLPIQFY